jgi:magnesium-dependent phosphatase 1
LELAGRKRKNNQHAVSSNNGNKKTSKSPKKLAPSSRLPRLVVFDLDGCLWRPEVFEILMNEDRAPFSINERDHVPGTTLKTAKGKHTFELLGDSRTILYELYCQERWYPTLVGISSRTDPPEWAHELLAQFSIYNDDNAKNKNNGKNNQEEEAIAIPSHVDVDAIISMKDIFTSSLCILDKTMDKATQFERLLVSANNLLASTPHKKKLKFKDMIFFDNEAGNCKQVAKLGVTCVYTPKGVTRQAWENGLNNFPSSSNRVLGPKLPY